MKILKPIIVLMVAVITASALQYGDFEYDISIYNTNEVTITGYIGAGGMVIIPSSITNKTVTSLGASSFSGSALTEAVIPESVFSIGPAAFSGCSSLTSIMIPENVSYIEYLAFSSCSSLTNVIIPASTISIGTDVFSGCSSLTAFIVNSANPTYSSLDGVLFNKSQSELIQYPAGNASNSYTIPNSVIHINERAFSSCTNLTSITIPDSVTRIEDYAFRGCHNLTNVAIPDSVTHIEAFAFSSQGQSRNLGMRSDQEGKYLKYLDRVYAKIPNFPD